MFMGMYLMVQIEYIKNYKFLTLHQSHIVEFNIIYSTGNGNGY